MQSDTLSDRISGLQRHPQNVRNICIMAHVDHGKTTLADALVASNGIISQKMAGKLRYMDSRKDEQERGITMKSSAITLQYSEGDAKFLINLIDSPGHVDFTGEVSSAVQLCDGALILVDVVEGVCAQTKLSIRQAWNHGIKMVLVLNKLDRLITEIKFTPSDAYLHLQQILEQVNAVVGELFNSEVLQKNADEENHSNPNSPTKEIKKDKIYDWSSGIDDTDDSNLYFSPDQGNVVFASGIDGWGLRIQHFAKMYAQKLGITEEILLKTLWGDFYLNTKTKRIMKGAQAKAKKPLFVQFILENVWAVYAALLERQDKEMTEKIVKSLNIKISARDTRHVDPKGQLQSIFNQWIPLAKAILEMVCEKLPSPLEISEERSEKLMCTKVQRFDSLPAESRRLKTAFCKCSCSEDEPVIIFVSKLFAVEKSALPQERPRPLTTEELALKRELARQKHLERMSKSTTADEKDLLATEEKELVAKREPQNDHAFIAFARVFSGTVRKGQQLYVLGPKHDPAIALVKQSQGMTIDPNVTVEDLKPDEHITMVTIDKLYILMGRELEVVDEVPAGNVLGIGRLESHVIKTATLSSTIACPPFTDLSLHTEPILRVALEPAHSANMPALVRGLKLLNQADASVRVLIQETGEHVVVTAGEVHLQRCLDDLRENFAKIEINVSTPIVPFRETVVLPPKVDMVNEAIEGKSASTKPNTAKNSDDAKNSDGSVEVKTSNRLSVVKMRAAPLPEKVVTLLDEHQTTIKAFGKYAIASKGGSLSDTGQIVSGGLLDTVLNQETLKSMDELTVKLSKAFNEAGEEWKDAAKQIWAYGPRRCGPNLLLCRIPDYQRLPFWKSNDREKCIPSLLAEYDNSFVSGFQLATHAGPLCEEPLRGVAFIVENWTIESSDTENTQPASSLLLASSENVLEPRTVHEGVVPFGPFSGQIISMSREACRRAFQAQPQRLMAAMYSCNILVTAEVLENASVYFYFRPMDERRRSVPYNSVFSLKRVSAVVVLHQVLVASKLLSPANCKLTESIKKDVVRRVRLLEIPKTLKELIETLVVPVAEDLTRFHERVFGIREMLILNCNGAINVLASTEQILKNATGSTIKRYILACEICDLNRIPVLFQQLSVGDLQILKNETEGYMREGHSGIPSAMATFWRIAHPILGKPHLHSPNKLRFICFFGAMVAIRCGSDIEIRYFINISSKDTITQVFDANIRYFFTDKIKLLPETNQVVFENCTEPQLNNRKHLYSFAILERLLSWPYEPYFIRTVDEHIDNLDLNSFKTLFSTFIYRIKTRCGDYDYNNDALCRFWEMYRFRHHTIPIDQDFFQPALRFENMCITNFLINQMTESERMTHMLVFAVSDFCAKLFFNRWYDSLKVILRNFVKERLDYLQTFRDVFRGRWYQRRFHENDLQMLYDLDIFILQLHEEIVNNPA